MLAAFVVIRKNDFLNFGLNRTKMIYGMEDYDSWISLAQAGRMGVSIPETLNLYRIRKDSMSRGFNENNRTFLYENMIEGHEEIYAKYVKEAFMLLQTNGQSFYWASPGADIPIKSLDGESLTPAMMQRLKTTNRVLNTLPGKVILKMYRGLKRIKHRKK